GEFWEEDDRGAQTREQRGIVATGWYDLDQSIDGFKPGDLVILAARPAMGKTAWCLNFARNVARYSRVLFFSLEMERRDLLHRMLADMADIDVRKVKDKSRRGVDDEARLNDATLAYRDLKLTILDDRRMTSGAMGRWAHRLKAEGDKPGLIVVDYLQLIEGNSRKETSRNYEIGAICKDLRALGHEVGCPVVLLSQLSRDVEKRPNKRPMLSDLRDSGEIEQHADAVIFIYRDDYYAAQEKRESKNPGIAEIEIAKNRGGPVCKVELVFKPDRTRFECKEYPDGGGEL
ncbi:MAG: replicative DNA helicase, partial [Candidatus Sericytochromatia bacterium]